MVAKRFALALVGCLIAVFPVADGRGEDLTVPGSGNPEFILRQLADGFNRVQHRHQVTVPVSVGTAGALRDIKSDRASLARVGRRLKGDELTLGLEFIPLGRDPVVFVAGAGVTVTDVSTPDIQAAFRGDIRNWRALGGAPAPIRAIGREPTDASRRAIARHIPAFRDIVYGPHVKLVHLDPEMVALLDRFPTSLGTLNRSALFACETQVTPLALDGIAPTVANVRSGAYPIWLEFGLIHKPGRLTPAGNAFIAFIQSSQGRRILEAHGVIPPAEPF